MINSNTHNDGMEPNTTPESVKLPIAQSWKLTKLLERFNDLKHLVLEDKPVTVGTVEVIEQSMAELEFLLGNQRFDIEDLRTSPRLKRTREILKDIEQGYEFQHTELLYLNDRVANILSNAPLNRLILNNLLFITDRQAALLGQCKADYLFLNGLQHLSDTQAAGLALFQGRSISLFYHRMPSMSERALQSFYPIKEKINMADCISFREQVEAAGPPPSVS